MTVFTRAVPKITMCFLLIIFSLGGTAHAETFIEGEDYKVLDKPVAELKGHVIEFFSYACPYCYRSEPSVDYFLKNKPADITFERIPVTLGYKELQSYAYASFIVQKFALQERLHHYIFDVAKVPLDEEKSLYHNLASIEDVKTFFLKQGLSEADYDKTFNEINAEKLIAKADKKASTFKVEGTPTFIINGKYVLWGFKSEPHYADKLKRLLMYLVEKKD